MTAIMERLKSAFSAAQPISKKGKRILSAYPSAGDKIIDETLLKLDTNKKHTKTVQSRG